MRLSAYFIGMDTEQAAIEHTGEFLDKLREIARRYSAYIVAGVARRVEGALYNGAVVKSLWSYILIILSVLLLMVFVPQIALWLPSRMSELTTTQEKGIGTDIKQLRYFVQIVDSGSFSRGKRAVCHPAHPAQIRAKPGANLGVELLHISGKRIQVTEYGQHLYEWHGGMLEHLCIPQADSRFHPGVPRH